MITKVALRNFKRFKEETLEMDSHMVLAGQNNSGKTSVIQAIAAWYFALQAWMSSGNREQRAIGIIRKEFAPVPVQEFSQLWTDKSTGWKKDEFEGKTPGSPRPLEIEVHGNTAEGKDWSLTMEFKYNNRDQIYARPAVHKDQIPPEATGLRVVHIPSFSGIQLEESDAKRELQDLLIGQGKPGDILRNLLKEVNERKDGSWDKLQEHIRHIFGYELSPPKHEGRAYILCEYRRLFPDRGRASLKGRLPPFLDINTAGSGFQQVLLLLAFLYARPATVLLIDEPDAHLHFHLQGEVHRLLREITAENNGQLIIATHSEVLIDATTPANIVSFFGEHPHRLPDSHERNRVREALKRLSSLDLIKAEQAGGRVLCLEGGESDLNLLREWAGVLHHPVAKWLGGRDDATDAVPYIYDMQGKRPREAEEHFYALQAVFPNIRGFVIIDGDNRPESTAGFVGGHPAIKMEKWARYEAESYLMHPAVMRRFIEKKCGGLFVEKARKKLEGTMPPDWFDTPFGKDLEFLMARKASKILELVFKAGGMKIGKMEYSQIAKEMQPEEIHPDVVAMLDAIADHFGIGEQ